jgi:proteic killer suppression protein
MGKAKGGNHNQRQVETPPAISCNYMLSVISCSYRKEGMMLVSFGDKATEDVFHGRATARVRRFPNDLRKAALVKLDMLNASDSLLDLESPPGNRLESLKGDLREFYSIRINSQWRLVFRFEGSKAYDVQVLDYH